MTAYQEGHVARQRAKQGYLIASAVPVNPQTTGKWPRRDYVLRARNGDPHDTRFENLELLSKRQNMLRNSIHNYPPELARLVQLRGALLRQINRREKAA